MDTAHPPPPPQATPGLGGTLDPLTQAMTLISVIIPVFNAEGCLEELYGRLRSSLTSITEDFEIVFVEDCSQDQSWPMILELAKRDRRVMGFRFSRNFGQHYGITAGLHQCTGDWAVVMDCDLQDRPEDIPRLYHKALEGNDVVLARRMRRQASRISLLLSRVFYKVFTFLTDMKYDGEVGNFRILSRRVVNAFNGIHEQLRFFGGIISWLGYPTTTIDVEHASRHSGRSSYTFIKRIGLALDAIMAHSNKPLKLTIRFGIFIALLSFGYGLYIIYKYLIYGIPILGWASLMTSLYFMGGVIISTVGMVGLYVGKTFDESKRRPLYVIADRTGNVAS